MSNFDSDRSCVKKLHQNDQKRYMRFQIYFTLFIVLDNAKLNKSKKNQSELNDGF